VFNSTVEPGLTESGRSEGRELPFLERSTGQGEVADKPPAVGGGPVEPSYSTVKAEFTFESIQAELFTGDSDLVSTNLSCLFLQTDLCTHFIDNKLFRYILLILPFRG